MPPASTYSLEIKMAFAPLFDPTQQFMARSGAPLAGGLLYVYRNTSQELATIKNVAGTTIANPVSLDADGRASGGVFVSDASTYTLVVKDAFEATQWTIAAMSPLGGGSSGGSDVTITPTLTTGTKIADFSIDGESGSLFAPNGGGGGSDSLWGHWKNDNYWKQIASGKTYMEVNLELAEGEVGPAGKPYLDAGLYDYQLELAFNKDSVASSTEFASYDLQIKYGDQVLREMTFSFRADTTDNYNLTEWAGGVFKMTGEGYISMPLWKIGGTESNHLLKVSHLFIHKIV